MVLSQGRCRKDWTVTSLMQPTKRVYGLCLLYGLSLVKESTLVKEIPPFSLISEVSSSPYRHLSSAVNAVKPMPMQMTPLRVGRVVEELYLWHDACKTELGANA